MTGKMLVFTILAWVGVAVLVAAGIYNISRHSNIGWGRELSEYFMTFPIGFLGAVMALTCGRNSRPRYLWGIMMVGGLLWVLTPFFEAIVVMRDFGVGILILAIPIGGGYSLPGIISLFGGTSVRKA